MNQLGYHFERKTPRHPHYRKLRTWLRQNAALWAGLVSVMVLIWLLFVKLARAVLDI